MCRVTASLASDASASDASDVTASLASDVTASLASDVTPREQVTCVTWWRQQVT